MSDEKNELNEQSWDDKETKKEESNVNLEREIGENEGKEIESKTTNNEIINENDSNEINESIIQDEIKEISIEDNKISKTEIYEDGENKRNLDEKNNKKRFVILGSILCMILVVGMVISITIKTYNNIVYPGITVYQVDLRKMSKNEVYNELNNIEKKLNNINIIIEANDKRYEHKMQEVIADYNKEKLVDEIMGYSDDKNIIEKFCQIVFKSNINYTFDVNVDKKALEELITKIKEETDEEYENAQIVINDGNIQYKEGISGKVLDENNLISQLNKNINSSEDKTIKKEIKLNVKYKESQPKISVEDLKSIDTKISHFATTYGAGGGRGNNVENATRKLDNMVLMPGDEFSYEKSIGPVVQTNGYTYAPVISNGELQQGIGGGVCQVSSTLYNAVLKAGILPTERRNHSKAVSYVPRGLDATLASGSIDYKFKNTHDYPIVLNTYTSGGKLNIEVWSNKNATKGIRYEPISFASGNVANSYLYGYDKDDNRVFEKHIDTSIYR